MSKQEIVSLAAPADHLQCIQFDFGKNLKRFRCQKDQCLVQSENVPWQNDRQETELPKTIIRVISLPTGSFLLAHSRLSPRAGYISRLLGPPLPGNMKYCLRFHYSLRGFQQTDQALTVYLQDQSGITQDRIWTQNDKSRGVWIATDITFQSPQAAKVKCIKIY